LEKVKQWWLRGNSYSWTPMGSHHKLRVRTWALYFLTFEQHFPLQLLATFLAVCLTIVCLKLGLFMFFSRRKIATHIAIVGYTQASDSDIPIRSHMLYQSSSKFFDTSQIAVHIRFQSPSSPAFPWWMSYLGHLPAPFARANR
jgi:hypothetical protein